MSPHSEKAPHYAAGARAVYGDSYAALYPSLYIEPWRRKHELNARNLKRILFTLPVRRPAWLDIACGQAWHFASLSGRARMYGLDLSPDQLLRAQGRAATASFICGDMLRAPLRAESFDLITNFWAGYCYLGSHERIERLLREATRWIRPGGALYLEILLALDLESFNRSRFAHAKGFGVVPRSEDYTEWGYDDVGGRHVMTSPPLEFFLDVLTPAFEQIEARHDGSFMVHLIATGRTA